MIEGINGPVFAVAVGIELILAIIFNLFIVFYTLCHYKILKQPSMIFLTGLALVNLLMPTLFLPFTVIAAAAGEWIFGETDEQRDGVCQFVGFVFSVAVTLTFHMLALISVDRFILIIKPTFYQKYMKSYIALILVGIVWLLAILKNISPFLGLGRNDFAGFVGSCLPVWEHTDYVVYYSILTLIPVLVIIVTTVWTFCFSCRFIRREQSVTSTQTEIDSNVYARKMCNLIGLFGMLLIIMIASIIPFILAGVAIASVGIENIPGPVYASAFVIYFLSNIGYSVVQIYFRGDIRGAIWHGMRQLKSAFTQFQPQRLREEVNLDHTVISEAPVDESLHCDSKV